MDGRVEITATVTGEGVTDQVLEQAIQRLGVEPGLLKLRWELADDA